jgi:hypothetical protein
MVWWDRRWQGLEWAKAMKNYSKDDGVRKQGAEWNCLTIPGLSSTQHLLNYSTMWRCYAEQSHIECRHHLGVGGAMRKFLLSAEAYKNAPYPWNPRLWWQIWHNATWQITAVTWYYGDFRGHDPENLLGQVSILIPITIPLLLIRLRRMAVISS